MVEEKKRGVPESRKTVGYEDPSKYLTQDPVVEIREYSDHVRIIAEVSDQDPQTIVVRPIDAFKIELSFKYRGRNIKKLVLLASPVNPDKYEVRIKNGVARISLCKSSGGACST
ncbi:MAG: hypothetical protein QXU80_02630 [Zestosphaera sp.]